MILYSLLASLLLYLLFESVWSNILSLMVKKRSSLSSDRKAGENQSKLNETANGRTGRTNETDNINRHLATNGANKWSTNSYSKDLNGNFDEYRVVSLSTTTGNVYVDVAQVAQKNTDNQSSNDNHRIRNTKL